MRSYSLTILLTDQCNANCTFCHTVRGNRMADADIIITELERFILARDNEGVTFQFVLMGGEPLMNISALKKVAEYVLSRPMHGTAGVQIVTNGKLLDAKICDWINENPQINVAISAENFEIISNSRLRNAYVKMVIYPHLLESRTAPDCVFDIARKNYYCECVCADGADWEVRKHTELLRGFFNDSVRKFVDNPSWTPPNYLTAAIWRFGEENVTCKPGVTAFCLDPDGKWFDCNRATPIYNHGGFKLIYDLRNPPEVMGDECVTCGFRSLCAICPAVKASIQNSDQAKVKCLFVKESIFASMEYQSSIARAVHNRGGSVLGYRFFEDRPWLDYRSLMEV